MLEIWTEAFAYAAKNDPGAVIVITVHPQVSGQGFVIRFLARLFEHLRASAAEFITMAEAARRAAHCSSMRLRSHDRV